MNTHCQHGCGGRLKWLYMYVKIIYNQIFSLKCFHGVHLWLLVQRYIVVLVSIGEFTLFKKREILHHKNITKNATDRDTEILKIFSIIVLILWFYKEQNTHSRLSF